MKFEVNDMCIACEMCASTCPEVFSMSDEGHAVAIEGDVPAEVESSAQEAAEGCPVDAIEEK